MIPQLNFNFAQISPKRCTAGSGFGAVKYTTISGIVEESAYPFTGQVGTCPPTTTLKPTYFMSNTAWINVNGDEEMMKMIVFRHGPALAFMGEISKPQ